MSAGGTPALEITNYKVSWRSPPLFKTLRELQDNLLEKEGVFTCTIPSGCNYITARTVSGCVYTLFQSGFVNCTGLRNINEVKNAVKSFRSWFDLDNVQNYKIDCLSAHCNTGRKVDLCAIRVIEEEDGPVMTVSFCPERFPGCIIRFPRGSATVYGNGKITFVGGRSDKDIRNIFLRTLLILEKSAWRSERNAEDRLVG